MPIYFIKWCEDGHDLTSSEEISQNHCAKCGKKFVEICKCGAVVPPVFESPKIYSRIAIINSPERPNNCSFCGRRYPWVKSSILRSSSRKLRLTFPKIRVIICSIVIFIVALVAFLNDAFGLLGHLKKFIAKSDTDFSSVKNINTVNTINQSGGIATNNVLFKMPARHITTQMKQQLDGVFKDLNQPPAEIRTLAGDAEAFQLATEIGNYMKSKGYKVGELLSAFFTPPIVGYRIDTSDGIKWIKVGSRE